MEYDKPKIWDELLVSIQQYIYESLTAFKENIESIRGYKYTKVHIQEKFNINISNIILEMDIEKLKQNPMRLISEKTQEQLEEIVVKLNDAYYNGTSIVSDEIYDILISHIEKTSKSGLLDIVGADVSKEKVHLPTFLPSMEKIKPDTGALNNWKMDYPGEKVLSDKLDGMSLLIDVRGDSPRAYTRGNGSIGQDITWLIDYINIGKMSSGMVRGELLVSKANWDKLKKEYPKYSNARNFVSGYTGRKNVSNAVMKYIDFVAYEYITEKPLPLSSQLKLLQDGGLTVVNYDIKADVNNKTLSEKLLDRRQHGDYEVDGIIITDNKPHMRVKEKYPKYAKAFKMVLDDQVAEVHVLGVQWEPSMHGVLNPVVQVSTVNLDGANISNATGYNAKFIVSNDIGGLIGPGAVITLNRSGGVIPKILSVIKKYSEDKLDILPKPENYIGGYSWTPTGVDIVLNQPEKNNIVRKKRLMHFFGTLEVPYFKEGLIGKVVDSGYDTIYKIIKMEKTDLLKIDGVKDKSAEKILHAIKENYNKACLLDIMAASHIFGSGFGKRKLKPIIDSIPDILEFNITCEKIYTELYNKLVSLDGYQEKTVKKFMDGLLEFKEFYDSLPIREQNITQEPPNMPLILGDKYIGRVFSSTGFRPNKQLKEIIYGNGGTYKDSITSDVTDLLVKNRDAKITGKVKKAKDSGINIMYLDQFDL